MYSVDKSVWVKYIGSCEVPEWYHKKVRRNETNVKWKPCWQQLAASENYA